MSTVMKDLKLVFKGLLEQLRLLRAVYNKRREPIASRFISTESEGKKQTNINHRLRPGLTCGVLQRALL